MTGGLKSYLRLLFYSSRFSKVKARYASLNPASDHVMDKTGMSYLKTVANRVERKGYIANLIYYQISGEDR